MTRPLEPGDPVMLVWACCAYGRSFLGWRGVVEALAYYERSDCRCGHVTRGAHAWVTMAGRGVVPVAWLRRLDPPAVARERELVEVVR